MSGGCSYPRVSGNSKQKSKKAKHRTKQGGNHLGAKHGAQRFHGKSSFQNSCKVELAPADIADVLTDSLEGLTEEFQAKESYELIADVLGVSSDYIVQADLSEEIFSALAEDMKDRALNFNLSHTGLDGLNSAFLFSVSSLDQKSHKSIGIFTCSDIFEDPLYIETFFDDNQYRNRNTKLFKLFGELDLVFFMGMGSSIFFTHSVSDRFFA